MKFIHRYYLSITIWIFELKYFIDCEMLLARGGGSWRLSNVNLIFMNGWKLETLLGAGSSSHHRTALVLLLEVSTKFRGNFNNIRRRHFQT